MSDTKLYFGGMSTDYEFKLLLAAFPEGNLAFGTMINYAAIADVIKIEPRASRFDSVVGRWIRWLKREHNIVMAREGVRVRRLDDTEIAARAKGEFRRGLNEHAKSVNTGRRADVAKMAERDRNSHTHFMRLAVAHVDAGRLVKKEIAPPAPPKALPRAPLQTGDGE
jgi:hypothetical protein